MAPGLWHFVFAARWVVGAFFLLLQPAAAQWTVAAYLGGAHTNQTSLQLQIPSSATGLSVHPISYADKPFESPLYYGYRAGYFFSRHFGVEGEFTHLKVYADTDRMAQISGTLNGASINETTLLSSIVQRFNITHGVNLLTGNLVFRKALSSDAVPRFVFEARAGAGITIPHAENEILGVSNAEQYQIGSPVIQFAAGLEIRLYSRLYALMEAKYTRTNESVDIAHGTATSLLNSTHAIAGLGWNF